MKIDIKDFKLVPFDSSKYIIPQRVSYKINGKLANWDFIKTHDCVSILLYHKDKDSYIFVKQFRAPLYYHEGCKDYESGFTIELCSGLIDKNKSKEQIAIEECIEELGFKPKSLEYLGEFYTGFGSGVSTQHLFFASVDDSDLVGDGGGVDWGEFIITQYVKVDEFNEFFKNHKRSALIEYANLWFLNTRNKF